jgi:hypothetical protein
VLAILNSRGMGGPTILPAQYKTISDWDLLHVYLAPRDDQGDFITLRRRIAYAAGFPDQLDSESEEGAEPPIDPIAASGIPREAFLMGVPVCYVLMFFKTWRDRGFDDQAAMEKLKAKIAEVPPWGNYSNG